jgi:hypothetical protein
VKRLLSDIFRVLALMREPPRGEPYLFLMTVNQDFERVVGTALGGGNKLCIILFCKSEERGRSALLVIVPASLSTPDRISCSRIACLALLCRYASTHRNSFVKIASQCAALTSDAMRRSHQSQVNEAIGRWYR